MFYSAIEEKHPNIKVLALGYEYLMHLDFQYVGGRNFQAYTGKTPYHHTHV
jgi:hypothetical protein